MDTESLGLNPDSNFVEFGVYLFSFKEVQKEAHRKTKQQQSRSSVAKPYTLIVGPIVVPCWGSNLESYRVVPKTNYYGAYG